MDIEYLPATAGTQQELVLLHGWGSSREIWRPLLVALRPWANITLVDIPGCAPSARQRGGADLEQILADILAGCPAQAVYIGWSLGGQLAVELAAGYPGRVSALVTICSNPKFVGGQDWPGMEPGLFAGFSATVESDPGSALRRFDSLQVTGALRARELLRQLPRAGRERASAQLLAGLEWLDKLDQRSCLPVLVQPQLHLVGGRDHLVPLAVHARLKQLLAGVPQAQVRVLPQASHLAPLDSPAKLAEQVRVFLTNTDLLRPRSAVPINRAKREVAESFSRAASQYDSVAMLQRDVGRRLLGKLDGLQTAPSTVLDLGCGTGFFCPDLRRRFPEAQYIGLDLAQGMVDYARERCPAGGMWLVGDAEALPLASNSVDLVFSSLAIQWCDRPQHLFAELSRILRPDGCCVFTSLGPDTLRELRSAWAAVDAHQHVNTFLSPGDLEIAAGTVPGARLGLESGHFRMEYQRVRDLLGELKTLGAHNMNPDRPAGLTSRRNLQGMLQAYEACREDGLLPATYDVIFGVLEAV